MFKKLGIFLGRHSLAVVASSLVLVVIAGAIGFGVFDRLSASQSDFANKSSESYQAYEQIEKNFGTNTGDMIVLFTAKDGKTIDDPVVTQEIKQIIGQFPDGTTPSSYFSTGQNTFVSADRTQTFVNVSLSNQVSQNEVLAKLRRESQGTLVSAQVGGATAIKKDVNHQVEKDLSRAETVSFIVLAILLVVVFRSFVAASLPLLLGAVAIVGAFFVTYVLAGVTDISTYAINVIIMLGLGLAIDYSLFMVGRFREELRAGHSTRDAVAITVSTAGRTVFFSGLTVMLSLLGLLVFPLGLLRSISLGGVAAVLVAMLAALTLLPALLRLLGHKINALSFGSVRRDRIEVAQNKIVPEKHNIWYKGGTFFMRRPWVSVVAVVALLLTMGAPFLQANFSVPDYRALPEGSEARVVSENLANNFNIKASPVKVIFTSTDDSANKAQQLKEYTDKLAQIPGATGVQSVASKDPSQSLVTVYYDGVPEDQQTQQLVKDVRAVAVPQGTFVLVGGVPAELADLLATIRHYIPYGLAIIVITLFILLFLMLGSLVIPLKAIIMNIISLSAAYGVLVWVFQEGHFANLLGLTQVPALDSTMPVLIFAIAFGLSMDYSVFLYSRIKEAYDKTGDNVQAVLTGLQKTGSIITSASILLFVVVVAFATARIPLMQQIGVGLSITVLIDAFVVRMVLVPALMRPLGDYNWWAPKPLKRLYKRLNLGE